MTHASSPATGVVAKARDLPPAVRTDRGGRPCVPHAEPPHAAHAESVHTAHAESVHAARADSLHADTLRTARAEPSGATHAEVPRAPRRTKTSRSAPPAAGNRPRRAPAECGDLPFIIRRDGTWLYRGSPIGRKELVCLFASVLQREEDGSFWLQTPAERGRIDVEDAPFVAVELDWSGHGRNQVLSFRTNVDQIVTAGPDHPIRIAHDLLTCEPTPYIMIRPGAGVPAVEARIGRAVYYELVALGVPELYRGRHMLGVWSCGQFFPLGELPPGND